MHALRSTPLAILAAAVLAVPATAQVEEPQTPQQETLIQALENSGQYNTLVEAIRTAGLEEQLSGEGPYTIFAPTDAAFEKLPQEKRDELLSNPDQLKAILSMHVVPQSLQLSSITEEGQRVTTLEGSELEVSKTGDTVTVQPAPGPAREVMSEEETTTGATTATVERADWTASNGVIHSIDTVILPAT